MPKIIVQIQVRTILICKLYSIKYGNQGFSYNVKHTSLLLQPKIIGEKSLEAWSEKVKFVAFISKLNFHLTLSPFPNEKASNLAPRH